MSEVNNTSTLKIQDRKAYNKPCLENGSKVEGFGATSIETLNEAGELVEEGSLGYSGEFINLEM
ncbi:MAG: hypothetical protein KDD66_05945 [Bdellovibrionales bacterium]|nr:hypothetical protein [Bdellovibrionales bacterium]